MILLGLLALGSAARGDEVVQAVSAPSLPRARLEVGYMADWRVDSQSMGSVDVSASGLNPGGLRAAGAVFFGDLPVGLAANFGWERFSLTCDPADPKSGCQGAGPGEVKLTAIGIDFSGGLAGRVNIAGWGLEGELGWAYRRLPVVDSATAAQLRAGSVSHHGPMLALRFGGSIGNVFLPDVHFAAVPYTFSATPLGASHGYNIDAGVGLGFGALRVAGLQWTVVLGYDFAFASVEGDGGKFTQRAHRMSLGLRMTVPGPERAPVAIAAPTGPGSIRGLLLDPDGKPLAGQKVEVSGAAPVSTDEAGAFRVARAGPGPVTLRAAVAGLKSAAATVEVPPEAEAKVELRLTRPTGPGSIRGVVFDKPTDPKKRVPVPGARVSFGAGAATADEKGAFLIEQAGPGLVPLKVSAKGYVQGEEVVSVPAEGEAKVELAIAAEKAKPLATLRGQVRGGGGRPLAATLTVPEAKVSATAAANGEFNFNVPGGHYQVRIEAKGYVPQLKAVDVADGDQAIFNIDMHPAK